jgi:hypothetical protein
VTESSFSRIKLQRRKENVVYANSGLLIATVSILKFNLTMETMEETLPNKGILEKPTREGKSLAFYTVANKLKP